MLMVNRRRNQKFPFFFRLSGEGSGEEPQKNGKEIFGVARVRNERDRGAIPHDRSVRFSFESPRAPRVRSGFAQR